jgi:hypothetical protein
VADPGEEGRAVAHRAPVEDRVGLRLQVADFALVLADLALVPADLALVPADLALVLADLVVPEPVCAACSPDR